MFPAYFSIRYHRLEATAKKWISESVLFRRVFTLAATVLFPHRVLKVLESFWVPQSLWLESWKFSFVLVLVGKGWALSSSPEKRKISYKFSKCDFTWEIDLAAEKKSLRNCSKGRRQGRSSGFSNQWQFLEGTKSGWCNKSNQCYTFFQRVILIGCCQYFYWAHISDQLALTKPDHIWLVASKGAPPHSRIDLLTSANACYFSLMFQRKTLLWKKHEKYRWELLRFSPPCSSPCYTDPHKTPPAEKSV